MVSKQGISVPRPFSPGLPLRVALHKVYRDYTSTVWVIAETRIPSPRPSFLAHTLNAIVSSAKRWQRPQPLGCVVLQEPQFHPPG